MKPVKVFPSVETILELDAAGGAYKRLPSLQTRVMPSIRATRLLCWVAITFCALTAPTISAAAQQTETAVAQIRSVLRAQQDAWNRGDIDGFMNGYARSASTVFISEDTIRRGWQTVRDRYKKKNIPVARRWGHSHFLTLKSRCKRLIRR